MKKLWSGAISLFFALTAGSVFGVTNDPVWLFADNDNVLFQYFRYCDSARSGDYNCFALESDQLVDTGDAYDKKYINLNYKFSNDTFKVFDEFDPTVVLYKDWRPGYAGFKTAWDYGMTGYPIGRYKYLVFAHKGPNVKHKVTVKAWYNNGECGAPSYNEVVGTFSASTEWKLDSIAIPDAITNKADKERNFSVYYELVFIINNIDSNDKSSSEASNFKMDNIKLVGCNPIDTTPKSLAIKIGQPASFKVSASKPRGATGDISYQWKRNGTPIEGATSATYSIATTKEAEHGGIYTVDVKVGSGYTFTSLPATLTFTDAAVKKELENKVAPTNNENSKGTGCGLGALLAFIPPVCFKAASLRRRKNKK